MSNILQFPGLEPPKLPNPRPVNSEDKPPSDDILKAMQILQAAIDGGMAFVIIGIKENDRGADFYMAAEGEDSVLRNAYDHLQGRIDKLYSIKGLL